METALELIYALILSAVYVLPPYVALVLAWNVFVSLREHEFVLAFIQLVLCGAAAWVSLAMWTAR